ncbi:MAG: HupE/UreJ family protein [Chamaesiphon sp.]|nr:HupE/UreJ family protein [Chamaesiphon sp.]
MPLQISKTWKIAICWGLGLLMVLSLATPSQAHWADLAVADIQIRERDVDINLTIPTGLIAQFDDDKNKQLSNSEITIHQKDLQEFLNQKIRLTAAGQVHETLIIKATIAQKLPSNLIATPDTHSSLLLQYQWSEPIEQLQMHYDLFIPGVNTARCLAQVFRAGQVDNLVFTPDSQNAALIDAPILQQISSFIRLGVEHIWTGYDHILFLVSLLMLGGELGYLLKVVTAFSLSHSVTLFLAALNIVSVPSRWVEIAIALSIAYIASENLWKKEARARWQLAFGFGLIHGLGFSSVMQELDLPSNNLLTSIASFSVGIELGQFAIVLAVYFALSYLRKFSWDLTVRRIISVGVIIMSAIWFWERAFMG